MPAESFTEMPPAATAPRRDSTSAKAESSWPSAKQPRTPTSLAVVLLNNKLSCAIVVLVSIAILVVSASAIEICVEDPNADVAGEQVCLTGGSWFVIWLTFFCLILMCNDQPPELVLLGATTVLRLLELIDAGQAWDGFASPSILAIGALFVFARVLEETRAVELIVRPMLGKPGGHRSALLRLCLPTALFSAFLNNTPIVAMLLSVVEGWCSRCSLSPRVMMMPLSFVSILGGMCTLIGTSTNLVLNALIEADMGRGRAPCEPFNTFSMTPYAVPAALAGMAVLVLLGPPLLRPPRPAAAEALQEHLPPALTDLGISDAATLRLTPSTSAATLRQASLADRQRAARLGYELEVAVSATCEMLGETLEVTNPTDYH